MTSLLVVLSLLSQPALACPNCGHPAQSASKAPASVKIAAPKSYGQGVTSTDEPLALAEALKRQGELKDKEIVVKAKVDQVCQKSGCWLTLKDKDASLRVAFKDYAFFVPKDSGRKIATVQGKLIEKEISPAEARHEAKEAGKSAEEAAKIQAPQKSTYFEATGLTLAKT